MKNLRCEFIKAGRPGRTDAARTGHDKGSVKDELAEIRAVNVRRFCLLARTQQPLFRSDDD